VPRALETIIRKATAKEPGSRYATAQELADDLRRFLEHRPIRARRPTLLECVAKWSRRHRTVVASAFLILILAVGGLSAGLVLIGRERDLASSKEKEASASAKQARERAIELERQLYVNRVNHAFGEWRENNIALADRLLQECPRSLRGWEWDYCRRLCHLERLTLRRDGRPFHNLAIHPDGRSIFTAAGGFFEEGVEQSGDWTLWDLATGREIESQPVRGAYAIAIDPAGATLAVSWADGRISLWKIARDQRSRGVSEPFWVFRTHAIECRAIAFSPDGRELAVGTTDRGITLLETLEVGTRRYRHLIRVDTNGIHAALYSPDGKQLAAACNDGRVRIWDSATGTGPRVLHCDTGPVFDATYSRDGRSLVTGGRDGTVRVWDPASGGSRVLRGHGSFVRAVAIHPDGTRIASGSQDNTVRVWDLATGEEIGVLRGHAGPVADVAFSPDGRRIASASHDGTVKIWDSAPAESAITLRHKNWVPRAVFTPEGSAVVSACWDNVIRIWEVETGREVRAIHGEPKVPATPVGPDITHCLAISPDGQRIASTNRSGTVLVWDSSTGRLIHTLRGHGDRTLGIAFHPRGCYLASAGWDGTVRIWDGESGEQVQLFCGPQGVAITATYSPDGTRIASAFTDGTIRIWDPADGEERMQLPCESHRDQSAVLANTVAFRPDGRWLAAVSNPGKGRGNGEVRVFDLATRRRVFTLGSHTGEVWSVTFTPDGRRIVTSGVDQTVRFWETETGQEVFTLRGHTNGVISVAFSADGRRMVTGSNDNTAKIWDTVSLPEVSTR
jgi:WD40 repeat protein